MTFNVSNTWYDYSVTEPSIVTVCCPGRNKSLSAISGLKIDGYTIIEATSVAVSADYGEWTDFIAFVNSGSVLALSIPIRSSIGLYGNISNVTLRVYRYLKN